VQHCLLSHCHHCRHWHHRYHWHHCHHDYSSPGFHHTFDTFSSHFPQAKPVYFTFSPRFHLARTVPRLPTTHHCHHYQHFYSCKFINMVYQYTNLRNSTKLGLLMGLRLVYLRFYVASNQIYNFCPKFHKTRSRKNRVLSTFWQVFLLKTRCLAGLEQVWRDKSVFQTIQ
jgi:hypothetical protein